MARVRLLLQLLVLVLALVLVLVPVLALVLVESLLLLPPLRNLRLQQSSPKITAHAVGNRGSAAPDDDIFQNL